MLKKRGSIHQPGYDAGKKVKDKKRHILVDTTGLMLHTIVHAADIQGRDGGLMVMGMLFGLYPFLLNLCADGGYQGLKFREAIRDIMGQVNVEIVKRSDQGKGFVVLPKRWGGTNTRLARRFLLLASIRLIVRPLCRK